MAMQKSQEQKEKKRKEATASSYSPQKGCIFLGYRTIGKLGS